MAPAAGDGVTRIAALAAVLLLSACSAEVPQAPPETTPHGYVEGAEETAEAQSRLVVADERGAVRVVDLITEEVVEAGSVGEVEAIRGDGRYAYLTAGDEVHVVDSGGWTVDHGDHVHYYRAAIRPVPADEVPADSDRAAADIDLDAVGEPCPDPGAPLETRRGVVFTCADGALLVTEDRTGVKIPHPAPEAGPVRDLRHRRMSTTLAGIAPGHGVWVLDVTARTWTLVPTGPVVAANTAGEGAPLLTLTADGVLHAHDIETGTEVTRTPLLTTPVGSPVIEVDPSRAYVNDAEGRRVHEIDYNDDLRVARTFTLDVAPAHMVETGR